MSTNTNPDPNRLYYYSSGTVLQTLNADFHAWFAALEKKKRGSAFTCLRKVRVGIFLCFAKPIIRACCTLLYVLLTYLVYVQFTNLLFVHFHNLLYVLLSNLLYVLLPNPLYVLVETSYTCY